MGQNGAEWGRMGQNGAEWGRIGLNGAEWGRMGQNALSIKGLFATFSKLTFSLTTLSITTLCHECRYAECIGIILKIDWLIASTACLVCLVSSVSGCRKNALVRGSACSRCITKLEQSTFLRYPWLSNGFYVLIC
jgi:hypothetical protein